MFKNLPPLDSALVEALYSAPAGIIAFCDGNFPVYSNGVADRTITVRGGLEYAVKAVRDTRQIIRYNQRQIGAWMDGGSAAKPGSGIDFGVKMALRAEFGQPHVQNFESIEFADFCTIVRDRATLIIQVVDETARRSSLLLRVDQSRLKFPQNLSPQMIQYAYRAGEDDPLIVVGATHPLVRAGRRNPVIQTQCDSIELVAKDLSEIWEHATNETDEFTSRTAPESLVYSSEPGLPLSQPATITESVLAATLDRSQSIPVFVVGGSNRGFVFYKGHTASLGFRG
jgi:hypothetical protein